MYRSIDQIDRENVVASCRMCAHIRLVNAPLDLDSRLFR